MRGSCLCLGVLLFGCASEAIDLPNTPSDDPADWNPVVSHETEPTVGDLHWVVPSDALPQQITPLPSNNNVDIEFFDGRLYLGWRTAPMHFASTETRMEVISSGDNGVTWTHESTYALGTDVREPRFYTWEDELFFSFFDAGTSVVSFDPQNLWRTSRRAGEPWGELEKESDEAVIVWDIKNRQGALWRTSYIGDHYTSTDAGGISVLFERSTDGRNWEPVGDSAEVYFGGVSEMAFEFMEDGTLWALGRIEDPDPAGMGSTLCTASASDLGNWRCSEKADPERYDSPEIFRYGNTLYLVARRDVDGTFGPDGDFLSYSGRAKTTALYSIDPVQERVVHIQDIPGAGDTAFPAVRRMGDHRFLLANYTSPLDTPEIPWLDAQVSDSGTQIYLTEIRFEP